MLKSGQLCFKNSDKEDIVVSYLSKKLTNCQQNYTCSIWTWTPILLLSLNCLIDYCWQFGLLWPITYVTLVRQRSSKWRCWRPYGAARATQLCSYCMFFLPPSLCVLDDPTATNEGVSGYCGAVEDTILRASRRFASQQNRLEDSAPVWRGFY